MQALCNEKDSGYIPTEDDWYAPLIGDWDFDFEDPSGRKIKGEWIFRKILEGTAIEDIFICPSRDTKDKNPQKDAEYGVAIRMYNPQQHCYDMTYSCTKYISRLTVRKVDERIVCTRVDDETNRWCFSNITDKTFHWQNDTLLSDGSVTVNCQVNAYRKAE